MQIIEHIELASAQSSITFSSIPGDYTDLLLVHSLRATGSGEIGQGVLLFNSSSANFSYRMLYGTGSAAASFGSTGGIVVYNNSGATSNTFASNEVYIPNYASSNYKSFSNDLVVENNGTTSRQIILAGLWSNTAAITSIQMTAGGDNFVAGSSATLYGITAGSDGTTTVS